MREITLHGMRFHALVGIVEHERTVPQPIEVDLEVHVARGGGDSKAVIDYRVLYDLVARTFENGPVDYLEEIGDRVAADTLAHDPRIRRVRVAVRKPHVGLAGPLDYAQVVTERSADA